MSNGQDKRVNWNDIPDTMMLPAGKILLQITEIEEVVSGSGKLMYKHKLTAFEPAEVAGMIHFENFVIGTDDDPLADSPNTWRASIGAKRMKNTYTKARVPFSESMFATIAAARGAMFIGKTVVKKDNDPNSRYFGQESTNITTCYAVGEVVPALEGNAPSVGDVGTSPGLPTMPTAPTAPAPIPAAAPGPALAPTIAAPAPPAPVAPLVAPAAPVKQMTVKAQGTYEQYIGAGWNDAQLIEHGFMEMVNPTPAPVVAPVMTPAPAPPTMAPPVLAPSLAPSPATPVVAAPTVNAAPTGEACTMCPLCKTAIPNSQFAMHVPACSAQRAAAAASGLK